MERALRHTGDFPPSANQRAGRRLAMPWGLLTGLEVVGLAIVSAILVLGVIPGAFDVEWGCVSTTGDTRTAADTYIAAFAVGGALGWLAVGGVTALAYATGKRALALLVPAAFFAGVCLLALVVAASIGPLPC